MAGIPPPPVAAPGIFTPGLKAAGSVIQAVRFSTEFSNRPAPIVEREPRRVRLGPKTPRALVPSMAWHAIQELRMSIWRPRSATPPESGACGVFIRSAHAANSAASSAITRNPISPWADPQNSAH